MKKKALDFPDDPELSGKPNYSWAEVLSRVFGIDVLKCDCGGVFKPIAAIKDEGEARRYLRHVGLDHIPPYRCYLLSRWHISKARYDTINKGAS